MKDKITKYFFRSTVAIFAMVLFSCENDIKTVQLISKKSEIADMTGQDIHLIYSDSARIVLDIKAKKVEKFSYAPKPYTEFPEGMQVVFFNNFPDTNSFILCNYAIQHEQERYWEAKDNVIAQNSKGERLNTEYLVWDEAKETIYSDKPVTITTEEDIIFGEGFESDQTFSNWQISKVKGTIILDDEE